MLMFLLDKNNVGRDSVQFFSYVSLQNDNTMDALTFFYLKFNFNIIYILTLISAGGNLSCSQMKHSTYKDLSLRYRKHRNAQKIYNESMCNNCLNPPLKQT